MSRRRLSIAVWLLLFLAPWLGFAAHASAAPTANDKAAPTPLIIAAALDRAAIAPVLSAFTAQHPDVALHYQDLSTQAVRQRVRAADDPPDVVISSAMPAQMADVNAGLAQPLSTRETRAWPARAKWRSAVFGFTFEPIVFAYRRDLARHIPAPDSHGQLYRALQADPSALAGRIAIYDPARSAIGYALYQADADYSARFWPLIASLGQAHAQPVDNTQIMLDGLSSGRFVFAYDLIGSYALRWAQNHPEVVVVVPRDYALVLSRMVFVHRRARHVDAAATFVDFLLSHAGQQILANDTPLFSVREDVSGPYSARQLRAQVGDHLYPIPIDAGLMAIADPQARSDFLMRWRREFASNKNAGSEAGVDVPRTDSGQSAQNGMSSSRSSSKPGSPAGG